MYIMGFYIKMFNVLIVLFLMTIMSGGSNLQKSYCPVIKDTDLETGVPLGTKVIDMASIEGHKVRLQFYYPTGNIAQKRLHDSSAETTTLVQPESSSFDEESLTSTLRTHEDEIISSSAENSAQFDVFCQWDFKAANDSQFLLLTFEKLSAPYSENCAEAYVAMQKQNAFESRWCGNRRQANARPMALFSRGSAKVSVYYNVNAASFPSTGFTVVVETVDVTQLKEGKSNLRVLLG